MNAPIHLHPGSFKQGLKASAVAVGLLGWVFLFQSDTTWWHALAAQPGILANLATGWAYAFLHGSTAHLVANGLAVLVLGTLSYGLYPRATVRALPLAWITSYLAIWLFGEPGSAHVGASGLTYGMMALIGTLGLLRRERPALGAAMVVWFLFGGAWWAMLPGFPDVSWEGHLGGAIGGALGAMVWRRLDPSLEPLPEEDEEGEEDAHGETRPANPSDPNSTRY